jgi:hypothetical protein
MFYLDNRIRMIVMQNNRINPGDDAVKGIHPDWFEIQCVMYVMYHIYSLCT